MEKEFAADEEQNYQEFTPAEDFDNPVVGEEDIPVVDETEMPTMEMEPAGPFNEAQGKPIFTKAIRWLVYAAAFLTPLWFLPFTADVLEFNKQILLVAVAGIGLVLYLVDMIRSGIARCRPSLFYWPLVGMVAAGAISVIFSVNRNISLFGIAGDRSFSLITLISFMVVFFLGLNSAVSGKILRRLMAFSLVLVFLFGVLQMLGIFLLRGAAFVTPSFNTAGSLNTLGFLAAVSLAFFASIGLTRPENAGEKNGNRFEGKAATAIQYAGLLLALFIVVLMNWWPIWAVAFVSLLALVAFNSTEMTADSRAWGGGFKMRLFAFPMAVIVIGTFLMLVNFNWTAIKSKFPLEVAPAHKVSAIVAWDSIKSRPLGHGLENFSIAFDKFKPAATVNSIFYQLKFSDATSEIINMAVNGGILMLLAFLALLWFYGRELASLIKNRFYQESEASSVWAASAGLLAAFFLYPVNMAMMSVFIFLLVLGLAYKHENDPGSAEKILNLEKDARLSFAGSIVFVVGLVLVLISGYFMANNYVANVYFAKAVSAKEIDKAIDYYVKSANSNGKDPRVFRFLSQAIVAKLSDDLNNGPKKDESKENYNARLQNEMVSAVDIGTRATNVDPANSQNWADRGLVYQNLIGLVGGADQAAISMYNESLKRNPADPTAYLRIGNIHLVIADSAQRTINSSPAGTDFNSLRKILNDNLAKAEENFKQAVSLYNNYGQALYNLAAVYDRQGKLPEAIRQFEKLQAANPQDPSIPFQLGLLYYRNNQKNNAFDAWQRAVLLFPNYSNARWYLSLAYEERGDLENALNQVKEIEKLNPDNELVKQRLTQLEAGKRTIPPEKVLDKKPLE